MWVLRFLGPLLMVFMACGALGLCNGWFIALFGFRASGLVHFRLGLGIPRLEVP